MVPLSSADVVERATGEGVDEIGGDVGEALSARERRGMFIMRPGRECRVCIKA